MKIILLIIISYFAFADDKELQTKRGQLRVEVQKKFGLPPNDYESKQIQNIIGKISSKLKGDKIFITELNKYYELMELKTIAPNKWSSLQQAGIVEVSPETPKWQVEQKLNDVIKEKEANIAAIINENVNTYTIKEGQDVTFNSDTIISSTITYNETTLDAALFGLVITKQNDEYLKTNIVFSPRSGVSTSVLITYIHDGVEMSLAIKEVRDFLIEEEVQKRLSSLD